MQERSGPASGGQGELKCKTKPAKLITAGKFGGCDCTSTLPYGVWFEQIRRPQWRLGTGKIGPEDPDRQYAMHGAERQRPLQIFESTGLPGILEDEMQDYLLQLPKSRKLTLQKPIQRYATLSEEKILHSLHRHNAQWMFSASSTTENTIRTTDG